MSASAMPWTKQSLIGALLVADGRTALAFVAVSATRKVRAMSESARLVNLLICVATDLEGSLLRERMSPASGARVIVTGVGPVNAAHAATVAILTNKPSAIVVCGIGGAYPSSGLRLGDVVSAAVEIYGDLGAQSPSGFLDMKALGFPVVSVPTALFNELPMQVFPTKTRVRFVTVSTCTGTTTAAQEIESRTHGGVENMEGAAIAHVAHIHGISVGEIRGVSNIVTNRDTKSWRLKEAAAAAQETLLDWMNSH
jgi:futalosine hydrolase